MALFLLLPVAVGQCQSCTSAAMAAMAMAALQPAGFLVPGLLGCVGLLALRVLGAGSAPTQEVECASRGGLSGV